MFNIGMREMILAGVIFCAVSFIILTALAKRPSVDELRARHDSQREKRDQFTQDYFKAMAFEGVIEDIDEYVVRVPYRELRYRLQIKPTGKVRLARNAPDTTLVYNFSDREELYFMLGHGQGDDLDDGDIIRKRAGKPYLIVQEEDDEDEIDTLRVSFRLFEPAEDLDPYVEAIRTRRMEEANQK